MQILRQTYFKRNKCRLCQSCRKNQILATMRAFPIFPIYIWQLANIIKFIVVTHWVCQPVKVISIALTEKVIEDILTLYCCTDGFQYLFTVYAVSDWNEVDFNLDLQSHYCLVKLGQLIDNAIFNIHKRTSLRFITRSRLGFSQRSKQKSRLNFRSYGNPLCNYSLESEIPSHFFD